MFTTTTTTTTTTTPGTTRNFTTVTYADWGNSTAGDPQGGNNTAVAGGKKSGSGRCRGAVVTILLSMYFLAAIL